MANRGAEERQVLLAGLANTLQEWHLAALARMVFRVGQSTSIIASHLLLTLQPLAPFSTWRTRLGAYAEVLEDEASWQELLGLLDASNS